MTTKDNSLMEQNSILNAAPEYDICKNNTEYDANCRKSSSFFFVSSYENIPTFFIFFSER